MPIRPIERPPFFVRQRQNKNLGRQLLIDDIVRESLARTFSKTGPYSQPGIGMMTYRQHLRLDCLSELLTQSLFTSFIIGVGVIELPTRQFENLNLHTSKPKAFFKGTDLSLPFLKA